MIFLIDVDDVLFKSHTSGRNDWKKDIEKDLGISQKSLQEYLFDNAWSEVVLGRKTLNDKVAEFLKKIDSKLSPQEFIHWWFCRDNAIDDGVIKYLLELRNKGHHLFLAANQERQRMSYLHKNNPILDEIFDYYFISSSLGVLKPNYEFFELILDNLGVSPDDIIFIDDSLKNIDEAKRIGFKSILYEGDLNKLKVEINKLT